MRTAPDADCNLSRTYAEDDASPSGFRPIDPIHRRTTRHCGWRVDPMTTIVGAGAALA